MYEVVKIQLFKKMTIKNELKNKVTGMALNERLL